MDEYDELLDRLLDDIEDANLEAALLAVLATLHALIRQCDRDTALARVHAELFAEHDRVVH